ncbi:putative damage-inducible protein DinB [Isoptericola halotolerans]|uniref:Damage-inducible protein DinB n=1 Tax=Isoptericola halotolerans TaxID=300560 RepID=A0ABX2A2H1_9MICO|nr:putative damage-inducible protein DinB [Isoptericola halotolerans]
MSATMTGMWVAPEQDPRTTGVDPVGEKETLWEYLCRYRMTLVMKCEGLDAEQLSRRSVPPSNLSLLGLVRHLANAEHHWFTRVLQGTVAPGPFERPRAVDVDFDEAYPTDECVGEAWEAWHAAVEAADEQLVREELGREVPFDGGTVEVRDVIIHMVEEYARHMGHADLLRECIDGRTGL